MKPPKEKPLTAKDRIRLANEAEDKAITESVKYLTIGRERIIDDLEGFRKVSLLDFFDQEERTGRLVLKHLEDMRKLSHHHQRWLKKIRIKDEIDGQTISIEGLDTMKVIDKAGQCLKMWDSENKQNHLHLHGEMQRLANMSPDELHALRVQTEAELREVEAEPNG